MPRLALFLLGTAGDVHPGISLVSALRTEFSQRASDTADAPRFEIHVVTHGDHCDTSRRVLLSESNELILVKFYSVGTDSFEAPKEEEDPTHGVQRESEDHGLIRAFQLISQSEQINLVVFNLFAFNAWNLAEYHRIPSLALTSFPLRFSSAPSGFSVGFEEAYPPFSAALKNAQPPDLTWTDLLSWQWRLFLDDSARFRQKIGAAEVPFEDTISKIEGGEKGVKLPLATPLVSTVDPSLAGLLDENNELRPDSVSHLGLFPSLPVPIELEPAISNFLDSSLLDTPQTLFLAHFGSMSRLSRHLSDPNSVSVLCRGMSKGFSGLGLNRGSWLLDSSDTELFRLITSASSTITPVFLPPGLSFPSLMSRLLARGKRVIAITHVGAGTVQSLLHLGVPQICVPLRFDQEDWAELVEKLGAGVRVDVQAGGADWMDAVRKCAGLRVEARVMKTDGVEKCLGLIRTLVGQE